MQMAVAVGDCSAADADLLRRAMGSKRGVEKIEQLRSKLYAGMAENGIDARRRRLDLREDRGVRELRLRREPRAELRPARLRELVAEAALPRRVPRRAAARPADGLLLAADPHGRRQAARRRDAPARHPALGSECRARGGRERRVRRGRCGIRCLVDDDSVVSTRREPTGMATCADPMQPPIGAFDRDAPDRSAEHRRDGAFAVRLGLADVSSIGTAVAERIVAEREARGPYRDMADVSRRAGPATPSSSRRSPPPARSTASACSDARRSGSRARRRRTARSTWPAPSWSCSRRCCRC